MKSWNSRFSSEFHQIDMFNETGSFGAPSCFCIIGRSGPGGRAIGFVVVDPGQFECAGIYKGVESGRPGACRR